MSDILADELSHFGVVGMHWGVRNDKPKFHNPRSSKEVVKAARANAKVALKPSMEARIDRMFGEAGEIKYSELSTKGRTYKAGSEFYRTQKRGQEILQDMTYASTNHQDRLRYRGIMAAPASLFYAKGRYSTTYETVLKATKNLKSPSEKERFDAFVDLMDTKSIPVGLFRKRNITGREYLVRMGMSREVRKLDKIRIGEKYYNEFVTSQFVKAPINTVYFNKLREKGYGIIHDDNDRNIVSKDPIMIIDTKGIATVSITQLSNDQINEALTQIQPLDIKK